MSLPFLGVRVVESRALPLKPSPGTDARRIVRHGLADVLAWLGENVGPKPGEETHSFLLGGGHTLVVSHDLNERLRASAEIVAMTRWGK